MNVKNLNNDWFSNMLNICNRYNAELIMKIHRICLQSSASKTSERINPNLIIYKLCAQF